MDSTAVDFIKYNDGCSFCNDYKKIIKKDKGILSGEKNNLINKIKSERRGNMIVLLVFLVVLIVPGFWLKLLNVG